METRMKINGFEINDTSKTYIIAEMSANHGHDIDIAKKTIKAAKDAGADCVKIQTYTADTLTIDCKNDYFKIKHGTLWDGYTLYDLYKEAYTPWEWHKELFDYAKKIGITIFSSPFDKTAVDLLEELNTPAYKIASPEILDLPLIEYIAKKGKPIIISTGIATIGEIQDAIDICRKNGNNQIALLKCTSEYPAKIEDANLATIPNMKSTFNTIVGLSDHTVDTIVPMASVILGGKIIEKHFILDRKIGGPDSAFSLDTNQFRKMVLSVREAEKSIGIVDYSLTPKKLNSRKFARSLFIIKDIKSGEMFTNENVKSIRPGYGLSPKYINDIIGKKSRGNYKKGTPLNWNMIE